MNLILRYAIFSPFAHLGLFAQRRVTQNNLMLALLCNVLVGMAMTGAIVGGVALFWIARQDGSAVGRTLGVLLVVATVATAGYLTFSNLWF